VCVFMLLFDMLSCGFVAVVSFFWGGFAGSCCVLLSRVVERRFWTLRRGRVMTEVGFLTARGMAF
jgi:hypothetical protein